MNQSILDNHQTYVFQDKKGLKQTLTYLQDLEYSFATTYQKLLEQGYTEDQANSLILQAQAEIKKSAKSAAIRNIVIGALFLVGGTILTLAEIGFIFWGAIVFGGFQCVQGIIAFSNNRD